MPGITGIIGASGALNSDETIRRMVGSMLHESFYKSGTFIEKDSASLFGWVAFEGGKGGPAWNKAGTVGLLMSGEQFTGGVNGDADGLVSLYEKEGPRFFEKLNGVFSGVLIDRRENKTILFNDRYGLGRIYYHESKDGFAFSTEAKALLAVMPQLRQVDMRGLGEYFSCGCVLQNRTVFAGVSLLPPASVWTFQRGQPAKKETYFSKTAWEGRPLLAPEIYYEKLKETFTRILPKYFKGDQAIALSVTGGLDSRMVITGAARPPGGLPCYTFGGMLRECADVKFGRKVSELCGQPHQVIPVDAAFFGEFPELARRAVYYTDGAMDVTGAVELYVNKVARKIAPIRLTGNYGDEVLRENYAFKADSLCPTIFDPEFAAQLRQAASTYAEERTGPALSFIAFKQVPWHHRSRLSLEETQLTMRSPYLDNELVELAYQAPPGLSLNKDLAFRYSAESNPALANLPTDRGVGSKPPFMPGKIWESAKEFVPKAEYAYDYGMPQWLAKIDRVLSPLHLDRIFLGRQKFYYFRTWYRHELSGYVKEVLLDPRTLARPYLNRKRVGEIVEAHTTGSGNYTLEIHKMLAGELLQRELIEPKGVKP